MMRIILIMNLLFFSSAMAAFEPVQSGVIQNTAMDALLSEDLIKSLRDPFQLPVSVLVKKENPKTDLEMYQLKDFKLNGVITGPNKTRAMITTPNNKVYFVKVGDRLGVRSGKITQILTDGIRISESYQDERGKVLPDVYEIKITGELVSLTKKDGD